jgi:diguanylate cyclase (GGDEF)-like protein
LADSEDNGQFEGRTFGRRGTLVVEEDKAAQLREAPPRKDRCMLTMLAGPTPGSLFEVTSATVLLGRDGGCHFQIDDVGLSTVHASIDQSEDAYFIADKNSTNGTFVNGARVDQPQRLADGDRIQIGATTLLKVALVDAEEHEAARRLYESAVRDPLTGAFNRRYLDERLPGELAYADRHGAALSLLLLDLDHFKQLNDSHGHPAGDTVLRSVVEILSPLLRQEDLLARYGGEEFVVVARGTDLPGAQALAERIRCSVEAMPISSGAGRLQVTTSIGIATASADQNFERPDALIAAADEALYRAKEAGRNCVRS